MLVSNTEALTSMSKSMVSWRSDATRWNSVWFPKTFRDTFWKSHMEVRASLQLTASLWRISWVVFSSYQQRVQSVNQSERETVGGRWKRWVNSLYSPMSLFLHPGHRLTCPRCLVHHRWADGAHRMGKRCQGNCCRRGRTWIWCAACKTNIFKKTTTMHTFN